MAQANTILISAAGDNVPNKLEIAATVAAAPGNVVLYDGSLATVTDYATGLVVDGTAANGYDIANTAYVVGDTLPVFAAGKGQIVQIKKGATAITAGTGIQITSGLAVAGEGFGVAVADAAATDTFVQVLVGGAVSA